jgi:hypothetical protein
MRFVPDDGLREWGKEVIGMVLLDNVAQMGFNTHHVAPLNLRGLHDRS